MSQIDQAFIRAYVQPDAGAARAASEPACQPGGTSKCTAHASVRPVDRASDQVSGEVADETRPSAGRGNVPPNGQAPAHGSAEADRGSPSKGSVLPGHVSDGSFQVDSFAWPAGCTRLSMAAADQIDQLADALSAGLEQGQHVVAMSGCRRGDGCTTLLLCVARRLAERALKVAVLDADFDNPLLARRLGLLPEAGWEEVLAARLPVEEVIVESVQDRLAVVPLCGPPPRQDRSADELRDAVTSLRTLGEHYDLVLVDWGEFGDGTQSGSVAVPAIVDGIDAMVLVRNVRFTSPEELDRTRRRVEAAGLVEGGIVENFVELRKSA